MLDKLKARARALKKEVYAVYLAARDPRTPWYAKGLILLIVAYALSPIDLIPDFIPVLGYLDDLILIPVGSTSVREAIEEHQPLLGLHGHIHETKNGTKIKRSVLVDPGSEYTSGTLRGVIVNIEPDRVLSYQFTSG